MRGVPGHVAVAAYWLVGRARLPFLYQLCLALFEARKVSYAEVAKTS